MHHIRSIRAIFCILLAAQKIAIFLFNAHKKSNEETSFLCHSGMLTIILIKFNSELLLYEQINRNEKDPKTLKNHKDEKCVFGIILIRTFLQQKYSPHLEKHCNHWFCFGTGIALECLEPFRLHSKIIFILTCYF